MSKEEGGRFASTLPVRKSLELDNFGKPSMSSPVSAAYLPPIPEYVAAPAVPAALAIPVEGPPLREDPAISEDGSIGPFIAYRDSIGEKYSPLGKGTYGNVYKFTMSDGQPVAVKILTNPVSLAKSKERPISKAEHEAIMLHKFSDTGLFPQLYAYGIGKQPNGAPAAYIFMECADGQTLYDSILKTPEPTPEQKEELKTKINAAAKRLHAYGYVHNDLKPENIYMKRNGDILLLDIDSCRPIGMERRKNIASSTKGYCMIHNRAPCPDYELLSIYKPQLNFYALSKVDEDIDRWSFLKPRGGQRQTRHRKNVTRKRGRRQSRTTR